MLQKIRMIESDKKSYVNNKNIHAALDIGNSQISCMIAQGASNNSVQIKVLGFGQHVSIGLTQGKVTDLSKLSDSIAKAVESAERMAGFPIDSVNCNINGGYPSTKLSVNTIKIMSQNIKNEDIIKATKLNKNLSSNNQVLLNRNIVRYLIDNNFEVENPLGLKSNTLTVETNNIFVDKDVLSNLRKTIELCHLSVSNFYITPEVSGISTMLKDERENNTIVIDIGANITSVGIFFKNKLIFSDFIPLGGIHITSDKVKGLGTESNEAEKIKIIHGSLEKTESDDFIKIKIPIISENGELISHEIPRAMLIGIIKPRVEELFEIILKRLEKVHSNFPKIERIVLTGGTSNLIGINHIAKKIFKCNVRLGKPLGLIGVPDIAQSPSFCCLSGLILKSFQEKDTSLLNTFKNQLSTKIDEIKLWFNDNL